MRWRIRPLCTVPLYDKEERWHRFVHGVVVDGSMEVLGHEKDSSTAFFHGLSPFWF